MLSLRAAFQPATSQRHAQASRRAAPVAALAPGVGSNAAATEPAAAPLLSRRQLQAAALAALLAAQAPAAQAVG